MGFAVRNIENVGKDFTGRVKRALIAAWALFKRDKCRILHLDRHNQLHKYKMENKWLVAFHLKRVHGIY